MERIDANYPEKYISFRKTLIVCFKKSPNVLSCTQSIRHFASYHSETWHVAIDRVHIMNVFEIIQAMEVFSERHFI
jgi:hypothetical protein